MTVAELRQFLEGFEDDTEVRIALQQFNPIGYDIGDVGLTQDVPTYEDEPDGPFEEPVVWLITGQQAEYMRDEEARQMHLR